MTNPSDMFRAKIKEEVRQLRVALARLDADVTTADLLRADRDRDSDHSSSGR